MVTGDTGCSAERYCVVQGPGSFRDPVNFSLRRTVAELQGVKVAQFSDFGLFSLYLLVTSLQQPRGYNLHHRMIPIFPCGSRMSKGVLAGYGYSGRGAGKPQTYPNFRLWQMAIPIHNTTARSIRSGPEMSENAHF